MALTKHSWYADPPPSSLSSFHSPRSRHVLSAQPPPMPSSRMPLLFLLQLSATRLHLHPLPATSSSPFYCSICQHVKTELRTRDLPKTFPIGHIPQTTRPRYYKWWSTRIMLDAARSSHVPIANIRFLRFRSHHCHHYSNLPTTSHLSCSDRKFHIFAIHFSTLMLRSHISKLSDSLLTSLTISPFTLPLINSPTSLETLQNCHHLDLNSHITLQAPHPAKQTSHQTTTPHSPHVTNITV